MRHHRAVARLQSAVCHLIETPRKTQLPADCFLAKLLDDQSKGKMTEVGTETDLASCLKRQLYHPGCFCAVRMHLAELPLRVISWAICRNGTSAQSKGTPVSIMFTPSVKECFGFCLSASARFLLQPKSPRSAMMLEMPAYPQ